MMQVMIVGNSGTVEALKPDQYTGIPNAWILSTLCLVCLHTIAGGNGSHGCCSPTFLKIKFSVINRFWQVCKNSSYVWSIFFYSLFQFAIDFYLINKLCAKVWLKTSPTILWSVPTKLAFSLMTLLSNQDPIDNPRLNSKIMTQL